MPCIHERTAGHTCSLGLELGHCALGFGRGVVLVDAKVDVVGAQQVDELQDRTAPRA